MSNEDLKSINVASTFVKNYKNVDTLYGYIRCLRPICSAAEIQYSENQLNGKVLEQMQQFFFNFWNTRHPENPEIAWLEYYKEVRKVNKEFSTFGLKGYDTDRGRVYLQYGSPSQRNKVDSEPSAYPYEIWEYDVLVDKTQELSNPNNKQTSRKFIFYNPDLVSNRYVLIHSTARGEIVNNRWEVLLLKRNSKSTNLDDEKGKEHIGGNADDNFNNPR